MPALRVDSKRLAGEHGTVAAIECATGTGGDRARWPLLSVRLSAVNARGDPLHLVFAVQFHFLEFYFFQQVFGIQVGSCGEFLQFCFVLGVLLCQTLILGVCFQEYVPRVPLSTCCHWPSFANCGCGYFMNAR